MSLLLDADKSVSHDHSRSPVTGSRIPSPRCQLDERVHRHATGVVADRI